MSPIMLLGRLRENGIHVGADETGTLRVAPASRLTTEDLAQLRAAKTVISALVRYRDALHHAWALVARGPDAHPQACQRALDDVARLVEDIGVSRAAEVHRLWGLEWLAERLVCAWCGEAGACHDPAERG